MYMDGINRNASFAKHIHDLFAPIIGQWILESRSVTQSASMSIYADSNPIMVFTCRLNLLRFMLQIESLQSLIHATNRFSSKF